MRPWPPSDFDIELQLLLEAIYLKYHYDFRGYAPALAEAPRCTRRWRASAARRSRSCRTRCCTSRRLFPPLLDFLTVQVSEMFRDPAYFRALREQVVPLLRTYPSLKVWVAGCSTGEEVYSLAILLREEGLAGAHADLRHRHQPAGAAEGRGRRLRRRPHRRLHREPPQVRRHARRCRTTTPRPTAAPCSTSRCASTSSSPTTAWRPTACSPRCSSSPAATC